MSGYDESDMQLGCYFGMQLGWRTITTHAPNFIKVKTSTNCSDDVDYVHIGAEPSGQRVPAPWAVAPRLEARILHSRHRSQDAGSARGSRCVVVVGQLARRRSASELIRAHGGLVASSRPMLVGPCGIAVWRCVRQGGAWQRHPRRLSASQMQIGVGFLVEHNELLRQWTACAAVLRRRHQPLLRQRAMVPWSGCSRNKLGSYACMERQTRWGTADAANH